jgi:hypothetical protein
LSPEQIEFRFDVTAAACRASQKQAVYVGGVAEYPGLLQRLISFWTRRHCTGRFQCVVSPCSEVMRVRPLCLLAVTHLLIPVV